MQFHVQISYFFFKKIFLNPHLPKHTQKSDIISTYFINIHLPEVRSPLRSRIS